MTAVEAVTCLVFTRHAPALWGGRGAAEAAPGTDPAATLGDSRQGATTVIDVRGVIDRKIAAIAAHRTQYPIEPEMFPRWMLEDMMGYEHFVRAQPPREPESDLFA